MLLVLTFTKRPEVHVAKTKASGKSHGMRAVCKLYNENEREAGGSVERKLPSSISQTKNQTFWTASRFCSFDKIASSVALRFADTWCC